MASVRPVEGASSVVGSGLVALGTRPIIGAPALPSDRDRALPHEMGALPSQFLKLRLLHSLSFLSSFLPPSLRARAVILAPAPQDLEPSTFTESCPARASPRAFAPGS